MNEDKTSCAEPKAMERQQDNKERLQEPAATVANAVGPQVADPMPQSYIGRWTLYLDDIAAALLPPQSSYHCWCEDCWRSELAGDKNAGNPELPATSTAQVRSFLQQHEGHDVTLSLDCEQEFADLESSARTVLLGDAIYRRHWVATMSDEALLDIAGVGPKRFNHIRSHIPYTGPPEAGGGSPKWEHCPSCNGTGLKLSDAALSAIAQHRSELADVEAAAEGNSHEPEPEPMPSVEESLARLATAIEEINSRLAALEKDRKEGVYTSRILLGPDEAAKALHVRPGIIWEAVMEGDLPVVRRRKGWPNAFPLIRSEALQEWLKWREHTLEPKEEPYVYVPPPELLCRRCGEREYYGGSAQFHLCVECHEQVKQERIDEKERKRAERLSRKKHSEQP